MAMAADDEYVAWVAGDEHGALFCARHDGAPRAIYDDLSHVRDLTLYEGAAYLASGPGVVRVPLHGHGARLELAAPEGVEGVAVGAGVLMWLERDRGRWMQREAHTTRVRAQLPHPRAIVADGRDAYVIAGDGLYRARGAAEPRRVLAQTGLRQLVLTPAALFVAAPDAVLRIDRHGDAVSAHAAVDVVALVAAGEQLCWNDGRWSCEGAPLSEGTPQAAAWGGGFLYWADLDGAIHRLRA